MTEEEFWDHIDGLPVHGSGEVLKRRIGELSPDCLIAFWWRFNEALFRAYDEQLWNAAYIIGGGCADDSFMDFRCGLIARGRRVYESALDDPDTLADVLENGEDLRDFEFGSCICDLFEEKTGREMPDLEMDHPDEPTGEYWDPDDKALCARNLPKLWKKFGQQS